MTLIPSWPDLACMALQIFLIFIIARVLLSWFRFDPNGIMATVTGFIYVVTDFAIQPLRRVLPAPRIGAVSFDFSALIVILAVQLLMRYIC